MKQQKKAVEESRESASAGDLSDGEKQFILKLLSQLSVNPLGDGAEETVATVRSIGRKLAPKAEG
jgi:hypothetical protein